MGEALNPAPELRAQIAGEVLKAVAETPDAVLYTAVFDRVMKAIGRPEEEVSQAIMHSTSILILGGILQCNAYDRDLGEIAYGADTLVASGDRLLSFIWREDIYAHEPDDKGSGAVH